jgi:hypothetical protein
MSQVLSACPFVINFNITRHTSHVHTHTSSCIATLTGTIIPLRHPRWIAAAWATRHGHDSSFVSTAATDASADEASDMVTTANLLSFMSCSWGRCVKLSFKVLQSHCICFQKQITHPFSCFFHHTHLMLVLLFESPSPQTATDVLFEIFWGAAAAAAGAAAAHMWVHQALQVMCGV